ncbi:hypothetical protein PhCBS80983_g00961 [Powellomyces hirtus]|uniref:DNA 3'-5' helicase n=1 Tax=Powellomyces hirtus TaxID=109895 RepID=A0A507ECW6_9FUNG|nr:hypothetical protein PhCBS80983_g00961 [Powellomyces hirtus]
MRFLLSQPLVKCVYSSRVAASRNQSRRAVRFCRRLSALPQLANPDVDVEAFGVAVPFTLSRPEVSIGYGGKIPDVKREWKDLVRDGDAKPQLDVMGKTDFTPSEEQSAILQEVAHGHSNILVVDAKAGSGKTTTLIQCLRHIPKNPTSVAMVAYNRVNADLIKLQAYRIAQEPDMRHLHVRAHTFHSYGMNAWKTYLKIDNDSHPFHIVPEKTWNMLQSMLTRDEIILYGKEVVQLVSMAKLHCIAPNHESIVKGRNIRPDTVAEWVSLAETYGIKEGKGADFKILIDTSRRCLEKSLRWAGALQGSKDRLAAVAAMSDEEPQPLDEIGQKQLSMARAAVERGEFVLDFDDLLYLPIIHNAPFEKFDYVFVDEAQDMSAARATIVEKVLKPGGRLLLFGDKRQQIYQFAGATDDLFIDLHERGLGYRGAKTLAPETQLPRPTSPGQLMGHTTQSTELVPPLDNTTPPLNSDVTQIEAKDSIPGNELTDSTAHPNRIPQASLADQENVRALPMSLCRRCPTSVIELAQRLVPDIQAAPDAIEGSVRLFQNFKIEDIRSHRQQMVICRHVIPLLNFAFYLLAQGIRVHVPGRWIGRELVDLVEFAIHTLGTKNHDDTRRMSGKLLSYRKDLTEDRLLATATERLAQGGLPAFDDRMDSLLTILKFSQAHNPASSEQFPGSEGHLYKGTSVQDFKRYLIDEGWVTNSAEQNDTRPLVILSTFHRARGLEMDNVLILNEMEHMKKFGSGLQTHENAAQQEIEENLMYIAYTRARQTLGFIEWKPTGAFKEFNYVKRRVQCRITGVTSEERRKPYHGEPVEDFQWGDETYTATSTSGDMPSDVYSEKAMRDFVENLKKQTGRMRYMVL